MKLYQFSEDEFNSLENLRVPLAVYQFIDNRVVTRIVSDGFCELFGFENRQKAYQVMTTNIYSTTHPDDAARVADAAYKFATEDGKLEIVYRTNPGSGDKFKIVHAIGEHIYKKSGERLAYVWYTDEGSYTGSDDPQMEKIRNVFRDELHQESILHASYYDYLTGLPNMSHFLEVVAAGRKTAREEQSVSAVMFIDVNGMKYYNQKYGFSEGDKLLCKVSAILAKHFDSEKCSRFGQDHFAVFADSENLKYRLEDVMEECRDENVSIKIGVNVDYNEEDDASTVCDKAKFACDSLKGTAISACAFFDDDMLEIISNRRYILDNFERALEEKWIHVYYQPIIRTANGRVCDEEALSRWVDPERGLLNPGEFIATLEDANLIYKLDLYVVDRILEKMTMMKEEDLYIVPQSVNLSRSDFDACDIVKEITSRVDAAGIERSKLTIEITESVVGSDFEFIKQQVERFQKEGFKVWMDDFGSGYSSLDVLQNIHFDLIKFDMHFMQAFNTSQEGKIILNEMIRMAMSLGIETVCEGVETIEQVEFLREIGCTKMQGFYFCRPVPPEEIIARNNEGRQIGFENPDEADYYAEMGRVNLYDPSSVTRETKDHMKNYFDTIPMGIIEADKNGYKLIRSNSTYREFIERLFGVVMIGVDISFDQAERKTTYGSGFLKALRQCAEEGNQIIVDEKIEDGATVHAMIKRIATNPVKGTSAMAVVILAIVEEQQTVALSYAQIANAMSADYFDLFYVDLETEEFSQYSSAHVYNELNIERHGTDFFNTSRKDALKLVDKRDLDYVTTYFTKDSVLRSIDTQGTFTLTYRLILDGEPTYVNMKAVRMTNDDRHIIIGVSNVNAQMKRRKKLEALEAERMTYERISALAGDYICIYTVDPETDRYEEYNATMDFENLGLAKTGEDFFNKSIEYSEGRIVPEDMEILTSRFTKENVMNSIELSGVFELQYRLLIEGKPTYVMLRAAMINEDGRSKLIVGINDIDARVRRDMEYEHNLSVAQAHANIDSLTGVKNQFAFSEAEERLETGIRDGKYEQFAIAVFDICGLDEVNKNAGFHTGNEYLKKACSIICDLFKRSPVFRIDEDSFAVIAKGDDYDRLDEHLAELNEINVESTGENGLLIGYGAKRHEDENTVEEVLALAEKALEKYKENM